MEHRVVQVRPAHQVVQAQAVLVHQVHQAAQVQVVVLVNLVAQAVQAQVVFQVAGLVHLVYLKV